MSQKPHFAASDELQLCAALLLSLFGGLLSTGGRGGVQKPAFEFQSDGGSSSNPNSSKLKVRLTGRKALCSHTSFILSLRKMKGSSHLHISLECFALRLLHDGIGRNERAWLFPKQPARLRLRTLLLLSACYPSQSSASPHESKTQTQVCLRL